ncbi:hypothetical protein Tco_0752458 [Tanacetum coccineum]|uniref:RNA-directed DNA polymerase, eukaryota n=1 Tax=Tanacetum coccineum TaxID=301880 RepID=A0ABQ4ZA91_9ASTR
MQYPHKNQSNGGDHDGDDGEDNGRRSIGEDDGYHGGEEGLTMVRTLFIHVGNSTVSYTSISSDSDPLAWGIPLMDADEVLKMDPYEEVSQQGQAAPPLPAYAPDPIELEDHPLPGDALPVALSPGYNADSNLEEDLEEDPANYLVDGGDNDDESSDDDDDDKDEEEEDHQAPADSTAVASPTSDHVPSVEETEPFETDESAATPPPQPLREENNIFEESEEEKVQETEFGVPSSEKVNKSEDPFGIYSLLQKNKTNMENKVDEEDHSLSHPPGFTPEVDQFEGNAMGDIAEKVYTEKENDVNSFVNKDIGNNDSNSVNNNVEPTDLDRSKLLRSGGSILNFMEEVVKVGQTMGYNMEGCIKDINDIIESQGEFGVIR